MRVEEEFEVAPRCPSSAKEEVLVLRKASVHFGVYPGSHISDALCVGDKIIDVL